jgi:purine-binding chemotaxis protein CheW
MEHEGLYCTFFVDGLLLGIEVTRVQEVLRDQQLTEVPLAHTVVAGLMNLRGQIVTAIDVRARLSLPPRPAGALPSNVVVRTADGSVSLLVDEIGDVIQIDPGSFEAPPETLERRARELIRGAYKLEDRLLLVLDAEQTIELPGNETN